MFQYRALSLPLGHLLQVTTGELRKLEKIIYYDLVKHGHNDEIRANKIAWAQEQGKIQDFKGRLRDDHIKS